MIMRTLKCKSDSKGISEFSFEYPVPETWDEFISTFEAETLMKWILSYLDVKVQAFARSVASDAGIAAAVAKCATWAPGESAKTSGAIEAAKLAERNAMFITIAAQVKAGAIPREVAVAMGVPIGML